MSAWRLLWAVAGGVAVGSFLGRLWADVAWGLGMLWLRSLGWPL